MEAHEDHQLILALRRGDSNVIDRLYQSHAGTIRSWVLKNNGSLTEAQDLFQDSIIALYRKAKDPDFVLTCPIGALLFSISRNQWLYALRKKKREAEVRSAAAPSSDTEASVHDVLAEVEENNNRQARMQAAFGQLSELCQRLLKLLGKGKAAAEIARELGMAEANTVYRRRHACGKRWRELYDKQGERSITTNVKKVK